MLRLSLRFRHDCPFNRIAERYPHLGLAHWFNVRSEYLEVTGASEAELADIGRRLARIRRPGTRLQRFATGTPATVGLAVRSRSGDAPIVDKILDQCSAVLLFPIEYRDGWEHYRILLLDESQRGALVRGLRRAGEVEVTRIADEPEAVRPGVAALPVRDLFGAVTPRQAVALGVAHAHGYFELPRRVTLRAVAGRLGIGRSTFEELVRKGERTVMRAALAHLERSPPATGRGTRPRRRAQT